jgi:hypothetical protein
MCSLGVCRHTAAFKTSVCLVPGLALSERPVHESSRGTEGVHSRSVLSPKCSTFVANTTLFLRRSTDLSDPAGNSGRIDCFIWNCCHSGPLGHHCSQLAGVRDTRISVHASISVMVPYCDCHDLSKNICQKAARSRMCGTNLKCSPFYRLSRLSILCFQFRISHARGPAEYDVRHRL